MTRVCGWRPLCTTPAVKPHLAGPRLDELRRLAWLSCKTYRGIAEEINAQLGLSIDPYRVSDWIYGRLRAPDYVLRILRGEEPTAADRAVAMSYSFRRFGLPLDHQTRRLMQRTMWDRRNGRTVACEAAPPR